MALVGRFATCNVSTPSSGAEGRGAGAGGTGAFSRWAAARGRRVVSSSGRLPTHDAATAATASTADFLCRFAGGSAGAHSGISSQSGISSSESLDMIRRALQEWLQVAALFTELVHERTDAGSWRGRCGLTVGRL